MSRTKATLYEQFLKDAAKELGRDKSDWAVERLGTLRLLLKVAQHKLSQSQTAGVAREIMDLMAAITELRKEVKPSEGLQVSIEFVEGTAIGCPSCGHEFNPHDGKPVRPPSQATPAPAPKALTTDDANANAPAPTGAKVLSQNGNNSPPKVAPKPVVAVMHRPHVSASRFHSQQMASGEVPPLRHRF